MTRSWALLSQHEAKSCLGDSADRLILIVIVTRCSSQSERLQDSALVNDESSSLKISTIDRMSMITRVKISSETSGTDDHSRVRRRSKDRIADFALIANRRSRGTNIQRRGRSLLRTTFATSVDPYTRSMIEHISRKLFRAPLHSRHPRDSSLSLPLSFFLSLFQAQYLSNKEHLRTQSRPRAERLIARGIEFNAVLSLRDLCPSLAVLSRNPRIPNSPSGPLCADRLPRDPRDKRMMGTISDKATRR